MQLSELLADRVQFVRMPASRGNRPECTLTTLFSNSAIENVAAIQGSAQPKKRGWLPLLTVLFLISYGLMTMLIVEQGATIESQRALIRELFRDSTELTAMKMKQAASQNPAKNQAQNPSSQNPSTQVPSTQAPMKQAPSSQGVQPGRAQNQLQKQSEPPSKPASDLADRRRALITI